jgi:hypothetical protein
VHRLEVAAQLTPAREAVPSREVASGLGDAHAIDRRDPARAPLVVIEVNAERLLEREPLDVGLELRPARESELAGELELHVGELGVLSGRAPLADALLRLLAQLLEIELNVTMASFRRAGRPPVPAGEEACSQP